MANRLRRNQPGGRPVFPWYSFPRDVAPEIGIGWDKGLMESIEPYLDKVFNGVHGQFMCLGWRRIFEIQEVVYKELVHDFLATVSFAWKDGIYVDDNLTFCLGGERRSLSLADFALRMEIYLPSEVHSESYQ
ncbi:unnamed protein product [Lactuca virosa]|uniref:Uncharacterized protein n=1 Tax=Lactuca virosa TaxID=75947 RepID=A0AAU9PMS1_9ASTR|nr:unnamed protein product [Lactuca virosa]